ncbi:MAG: GerMN domain-containing protein [Bacilli bacterium]|nr:GerMN domain-containing protein [Bacilli bacterium]
MLKRKALRKIFVTTFVMFILLTIYFIPTSDKKNNNIEYHYLDVQEISIYLLNNNDQLTKVDFKIKNDSTIDTIKSIIKKLTISNDATIPNGLEQVIPKDCKLLDVVLNEKKVELNFSKEFLDIGHDNIETVVESISFSILNIEGIDEISILVEDENISRLFPVLIPNIITKEYGINKRVELKSFNDVSSVTVFYIDNIDNQNYYVPITKYVNDKRDKIKIIIDELSSNYIYESNLITLLDKNIKLVNYEINNDTMILNFNNSIFMEKDSILEEVVYTVSYSVFANYDVNEVVFMVNNEEILKKGIE